MTRSSITKTGPVPGAPASPTHVALLRGINVGTAKRVAMADLRALLARLGAGDPKTLLNSGNAVFAAGSRKAEALAGEIERAIADELGVSCRVTVLTRVELDAVVADNALLARAHEPARLMVAVPRTRADLARLAPLAQQDWGAEALAVGRRAAYLWCAEGILASRLATAVEKTLRDAVTSRNWTTISKLHALLRPDGTS